MESKLVLLSPVISWRRKERRVSNPTQKALKKVTKVSKEEGDEEWIIFRPG
jgi:hypothetical protein